MLAENLAAYSCGQCLGTLVSLVAYRAWRENAGRGLIAATSAAVAEPESGNDTGVEPPDSTGAKKCPKCRALMSKYRISAEKRNRLDYCSHCEEVWLDDGEWQLVESLALTGELAKVFTQAWQYAVRAGVSHGMEEHRLREILGDNYERVIRFAEWLQHQPAKAEILARLSRHVR